MQLPVILWLGRYTQLQGVVLAKQMLASFRDLVAFGRALPVVADFALPQFLRRLHIECLAEAEFGLDAPTSEEFGICLKGWPTDDQATMCLVGLTALLKDVKLESVTVAKRIHRAGEKVLLPTGDHFGGARARGTVRRGNSRDLPSGFPAGTRQGTTRAEPRGTPRGKHEGHRGETWGHLGGGPWDTRVVLVRPQGFSRDCQEFPRGTSPGGFGLIVVGAVPRPAVDTHGSRR